MTQFNFVCLLLGGAGVIWHLVVNDLSILVYADVSITFCR